MRKAFSLSILLLLGIFVCSGFALPIPVLPGGSVYDTYLHPNDAQAYQRDDDVIGNPDVFNIYGHRWVAGKSKLEIYLSWDFGLTGRVSNAMLGDVFLYDSSGTSLEFFVPVRDHVPGYDGNAMSQGLVYNVEATRLSNDYYPTSSTGIYGDNEVVTADGTATGQSALIFYNPGSDYNTIQIDFLADYGFDGRAIRFAYTCGNDVHAPVPEPATMILFGAGLIGLAGFGRRKFKK